MSLSVLVANAKRTRTNVIKARIDEQCQVLRQALCATLQHQLRSGADFKVLSDMLLIPQKAISAILDGTDSYAMEKLVELNMRAGNDVSINLRVATAAFQL